MAWINTEEGQRVVEDCCHDLIKSAHILQRLSAETTDRVTGAFVHLERHVMAGHDYDKVARYAMHFLTFYNTQKRLDNALKVLATEAVKHGIYAPDERL